VPLDPVLEGGVKGHPTKGKYLTVKPRPLGHGFTLQENNKVPLNLQEEQLLLVILYRPRGGLFLPRVSLRGVYWV